MKSLKPLHILAPLIVAVFFNACAVLHQAAAPAVSEKAQERANQTLLVTNERFLFWTSQTLYAFENRDGIWRRALPPMKAAVGINGFAPPGEKREGDGRTPSGTFKLGTAFGYAPQVKTQMPYRQALPDDLWVDDPKVSDYNRWVKQNETQAASYEKMKRDDDQYKYGIVIEYNTAPVTAGHGSAIFLHVWKNPGSTTAGCVAVSEENMVEILNWLSPAAHPVIIINPD